MFPNVVLWFYEVNEIRDLKIILIFDLLTDGIVPISAPVILD